MSIRRVAGRLAMAFIAMSMSGIAAAQAYPAKPIRWIVPYPPGGGLDIITRLAAGKMQENMGQPILVENRPGASGIVAIDLLMKSPADGYTILVGDLATLSLNPIFYAKLPYDPFRDLEPISRMIRAALMLVVPTDSPVKSAKELVTLAQASPGKLNYGIPGVGAPHHLAMEFFLMQANARITNVAFKGAAPAVQELVANRLDAMFLDLGSGGPSIRAGKLRALAVGNVARLAQFPDVPTVAEAGFPGYEAVAWSGVVAPAKTPRELVSRLNSEVGKALTDPAVRQRMSEIGFENVAGTPEELTQWMKSEQEKWTRVIRTANIKLE